MSLLKCHPARCIGIEHRKQRNIDSAGNSECQLTNNQKAHIKKVGKFVPPENKTRKPLRYTSTQHRYATLQSDLYTSTGYPDGLP